MSVPLVSRLLLADDHAMVRGGLRAILDAQSDLTVAAEAADGAEAVEAALREPVDLAVLDVSMPKLTGLQAAQRILEQRPEIKVLMLSMHDSEQYFFEALRVGAAGYVLKNAADTDLVEACRAAIRGESYIYPGAVRSLVRRYIEAVQRGEEPREDPLSPRETEVLKLIAEGASGREIAETLHISEHTVERHRANLLSKLGMRDRVALARYAIRRGLIQP